MNTLPVALVGIVAALLAFDKRYEDGLIRHISLGSMVVASVIIVFGDVFAFYEYEFSTELKILLWSYAIFFFCHAYSFIKWRLTGSNAWTRKNDDGKPSRT